MSETGVDGPFGVLPEVAAVRDGEHLDWATLESYLLASIPGLAGRLRPLQFPNGSANLTYLLCIGEAELVLRRPPFGVVAPGAHDMRREFRVLSRLWRVFDRAPRAYLLCDDHSVIGSDFVVMERRVGEVVRDGLPRSMANLSGAGRRLGFAVVDAMADLHLLDPAEAGLADLGRPDGFTRRQIEGWSRRWQLVRPENGPPEMDEIPVRLARNVPPPSRVSVIHNDLKIDNCQFTRGEPDRVSSIFDWDMTTQGEPLVDVGTLLNYWPDPSDTPRENWRTHPGLASIGLPSRAEVLAHYSARTGIPVDAAGWYEAFAYWKTGVVIQQLHNRWLRGESTDPRMATIADRLPVLAAAAFTALDGTC